MIPKTIHYCWFGGNPKSELIQKCMDSWRKLCPDYEIKECNESNYSIEKAPLYVRQAYEAKKWAFVTDYVRLQIIYENGGIYLDTDVELLKRPDELLKDAAYFGFQHDLDINTGIGFGAEKGSPILLELMRQYQDIPFLLPNGRMDSLPCSNRNTEVFVQHGLIRNDREQTLLGGIHIYPSEYFSPLDYTSGKLLVTKNSYSIHHFVASWYSKGQILIIKKKREYIQKYGMEEGLRRLARWKKRNSPRLAVLCHGWKGAFDRLLERVKNHV